MLYNRNTQKHKSLTITYNQIKNSMRRENFEKMNKHRVLPGFKSHPPVNYRKSFLLRGN